MDDREARVAEWCLGYELVWRLDDPSHVCVHVGGVGWSTVERHRLSVLGAAVVEGPPLPESVLARCSALLRDTRPLWDWRR